MKKIVSLLILLAFCACSQRNLISEEEYQEYTKQLGWDQPDSLRTPEQSATLDKFIEVTLSNTVIKKNQMYLTAKKNYFVEQGLPAICYDMAIFQYHNNNKFIKELEKTEAGKMLDISEAFEEAKKEILNK